MDETFLLRLGDVSFKIRDQIVNDTKPYTVPLIINDIPLGSGTLVAIDGFYGVLTASHVVRHPNKPALHLEDTSADGPKLLIPPRGAPGGTSLHSSLLRIIRTDSQTEEFGPDLAMIVLPPGEVLDGLKARDSFYPLAKDIEKKIAGASVDNGFVAFCGFPAGAQVPYPSSRGFEKVLMLGGFTFLTGEDNREDKDGWDYLYLGVTPSEIDDIDGTFGGVSGGGVWRIPIYRKAGAPEGTEYYEDRIFTGVAFWEQNNHDGTFFVRTHGPKSIYENFLPTIREQLARYR